MSWKIPARERWREIIPESNAVIENVSLAGGKVFVNYLENVKSRVKVFEPDGEHTADIAFPAIGSVSEVGGRWESPEAFFAFSSFHIPMTIYRYDVSKLRREVWARLEVPVESDKMELRQVWYQSKDKTWVPMFLLHAQGAQTRRVESNIADRLRGVQHQPYPEVLRQRRPVGREWRRLRIAQPARGRRIWRAMA